MADFEFKQIAMGVRVQEKDLPPVRIRDPWWRSALVGVGILKPRYRPGTFGDEQARISRARAEAQQVLERHLLS